MTGPAPSASAYAAARKAEMHALAAEVLPLPRSLTGEGVRETLRRLSEKAAFEISETPSGTRAFDWTTPPEWRVREAWLKGPDGRVIADMAENTLRVVGYSTGYRGMMTRAELEPHLHSLPQQPDAIPYVTSYYAPRWGFCLTQNERDALPEEGAYEVCIDAEHFDGSLTIAESYLPGETDEEVLISSYVCHPAMANNELSGPIVATFLAEWLATAPRRFSYRIALFPETIGSLVYLSQRLEHLQSRVIAGFHLSCIGDERGYGFVPTRYGDTLADRVASAVLRDKPGYQAWSFLDRGSDERQYQAPGVDLPVVTLCRTKFGAYPEYHTSLDDLRLVTPDGLAGGLSAAIECVQAVEANRRWRATVPGEPQLGKRGLYPTLSVAGGAASARKLLDVLAYCDGRNDLPALAECTGMSLKAVIAACALLAENELVEPADAAQLLTLT